MARWLRSSLLAGSVWLTATAAPAALIDFDAFAHGEVIDLQLSGVTVSADNQGGGPDLAVVFDSNRMGTRDPDLESASGGRTLWSGGNLQGTDLGGILILQENGFGCGDGICNRPDDEGSRPAGSITFDFDAPLSEFGLDVIDIDSHTQEMGGLVFLGSQGSVAFDFADLLLPGMIGDNTANRIAALDVLGMGIGEVSRVRLELGGSGAIDNVAYGMVVLPEPGTAALLALGLTALVLATRRRAPK